MTFPSPAGSGHPSGSGLLQETAVLAGLLLRHHTRPGVCLVARTGFSWLQTLVPSGNANHGCPFSVRAGTQVSGAWRTLTQEHLKRERDHPHLLVDTDRYPPCTLSAPCFLLTSFISEIVPNQQIQIYPIPFNPLVTIPLCLWQASAVFP